MGHSYIAGGVSLIFITLKWYYSLQGGIYPVLEAIVVKQHQLDSVMMKSLTKDYNTFLSSAYTTAV